MEPKGERLEPLGASNDINNENPNSSKNIFCQKCVCLEDERDLLQTSLFSLTTHLAQVQFRLKQIVDAPFEEQEDLLKSLEEFAFGDANFLSENIIDDALVETVIEKRNQQKTLLGKLKFHLKELKKFDGRTENENLVREFKTQIADLERFVQHLQNKKCVCQKTRKSFGEIFYEIIEKTFAFAQMFTLVQFWGSNCFTTTTTTKNWHWGDLRAKLELAIIDLEKMIHSKEKKEKIAIAVRKSLATSIRDLMQHGTKSNWVLPFVEYFSKPIAQTHGWDIILYYYRSKKGDEYNSATRRKLSKSFSLSPEYNKNLLCVIEEIASTHSRYKRSQDSHFKAFVCAGLNTKRLVSWLNLIFHCRDIIETFYYPWSYVASTRYEDGLKSLDVLTMYKFDLPVDVDVRKFHIEDNVFI